MNIDQIMNAFYDVRKVLDSVEKSKDENTKCAAFGCENRKGQGLFVGEFCACCYEDITKGRLSIRNRIVLRDLVKNLEQQTETLKRFIEETR